MSQSVPFSNIWLGKILSVDPRRYDSGPATCYPEPARADAAVTPHSDLVLSATWS